MSIERKSDLENFVIQYRDVFKTHIAPKLTYGDHFFLGRVSKTLRKVVNPIVHKHDYGSWYYDVLDSLSRLKWAYNNNVKLSIDCLIHDAQEGHEEKVNYLLSFTHIEGDLHNFFRHATIGGLIEIMKREFVRHKFEVENLFFKESSQSPTVIGFGPNEYKERKRSYTDSINYTKQNCILYEATTNGHIEILKWLCPLFLAEYNLEMKVDFLCELLQQACEWGRIDCAAYLLSLGAEKDVYSVWTVTMNRNREMLEWCIDNDFPMDQDLIDDIFYKFNNIDLEFCKRVEKKFTDAM
jgi:hypothetical protein